MKGIILLISILGYSSHLLFAQQAPRYTNYLFNGVYANPAVVGTNGYTNIMGSYRNQWMGIENSPRSYGFSADGNLLDGAFGIGASINNDAIGDLHQTNFNLNTAYILPTGEKSILSFGLGLGVLAHKIDLERINEAGLGSDPAIDGDRSNFAEADIKLGAFYKNPWLFAAFSVINMNNNTPPDGENFKGVDYGNHYYGTLGFNVKLSNFWTLRPSSQVRISSTGRVEVDATAQMVMFKVIALGPSLKFDATRERLESVSMFVDFYMNDNFRVLYAFDIATSELSRVAGGTHEVGFSVRLLNKKNALPGSVHTRHFHN